MPASVVQRIGAEYGIYTDGQTFAFGSNTVAGNAIVVMLTHSYLGCPPSLTDSQGNTYTSKGANPTPGSGRLWVFTAVAGSSAACTITVSMACGNAFLFFACEVSGLQSDPFDGENVASDASSPYETGSVTPTADGALLMAMWHKAAGAVGGTSVTSPLSITVNNTNSEYADGIQSSAGAINVELTGPSGTVYGYLVAFKAVADFNYLPLFGRYVPRQLNTILRR